MLIKLTPFWLNFAEVVELTREEDILSKNLEKKKKNFCERKKSESFKSVGATEHNRVTGDPSDFNYIGKLGAEFTYHLTN